MIRLLYSNTGYVWQYSTSHVFQLQAIFSANSHSMDLSLDFQAANHLQLLNQEYWFDATAGLFLSERSSAFYRREYCLTALPLLLKHLVGTLLPQFNIFLTEVKKCNAFTGHSSSKPYSSFTVNTLNPWNNMLCVFESFSADFVAFLIKHCRKSENFLICKKDIFMFVATIEGTSIYWV